MFLERLWEGFCNILSGVGGSEWGLCSIVGPGQEGIINSFLNAPSIATSDRVHSSSLRRYIGILSQFSNSNSAEIDVYKKIRYISCVSSVLHCLVNNVCGKKMALLSEIHIFVYHGQQMYKVFLCSLVPLSFVIIKNKEI